MHPDPIIENNSQQATQFTEGQSVEITLPSDAILTEAARHFWDGDSVFDQYDRKLALQYFHYVISNHCSVSSS